jgi:hypothetical protein
VAYPVQAFRLDFVYLRTVPPLSKTGGNGRGKCPSLFDQFGNCQENDLEYTHKIIRRQMTVRVLRV